MLRSGGGGWREGGARREPRQSRAPEMTMTMTITVVLLLFHVLSIVWTRDAGPDTLKLRLPPALQTSTKTLEKQLAEVKHHLARQRAEMMETRRENSALRAKVQSLADGDEPKGEADLSQLERELRSDLRWAASSLVCPLL